MLVVQLPVVVADMASRLSQAAVFISLLRLEEQQHEPRPFGDELENIEDHAQHGLYGILCRLHVIHRLATALDGTTNGGDVDLSASIDQALASVELMGAEGSRPAHRHLRMISIISDLATLLRHFILVLDFPL